MSDQALRLPLAVQPSNRGMTATATDKDAKVVNAFLTPDPDTQELILSKRPGIVDNGNDSDTTTTGYGIVNWNGNLYMVGSSGGAAQIYLVAGFGIGNITLTAKGVVDVGVTKINFIPCLSGANQRLFMTSAGADGTLFTGLATSTPAGANYPGAAQLGTAAWLEGTLYVPAGSYIYGSDYGDPSTFSDTTNRILVQAVGDPLLAIWGYQNYILAFKSFSMDVYWNAGNPTGSPLQIVQGAHADIGMQSFESIAKVGEDLFWIGKGKDGLVQVYRMSGLRPAPISTPPVNRLIAALANNSVAGYAVNFLGHRFYVIGYYFNNNPAASDITLAYDIDLHKWYQWTWYDGSSLPFLDSCTAPQSTAALGIVLATAFVHRQNGHIYTLYPLHYTDADGDFAVEIVTPNLDGKTRFNKVLSRLDVNGDQVEGSILQVRWSDDDYQTWSEYLNLDMGLDVPSERGLGSFTRRAFHLKHKQNTPLRLRSVDLYPDLGTS